MADRRLNSWGKPDMDVLEGYLRAVLGASGVPAADQSSILHVLAADADAAAVGDIVEGASLCKDGEQQLRGLLQRFRDYAVKLRGESHHDPIWAEVADALESD